MIVKTLDKRPTFSCVCRFKQCGRFNSAVQRVGFFRMAQRDLPDLFQGSISVRRGAGGGISVLHGRRRRRFSLGKLYAVGFRLGPGFSKVIRGTQVRAPVGAVDRSPETLAAVAIVVSKSVDRATGKIRPADFPLLALFV